MSTCALCLNEAKLCESHIVPEFLYAELYNDRRQLMAISGTGSKGWKPEQKGLREHLLCAGCERTLNEDIEIPFQNQWTHRNLLPARAFRGDVIRVSVDYKALKLFHLSILFRTSVASGGTFSAVSLGKHENALRQMILAGDPGEPEQYPIVGQAVINARGELDRRFVTAPWLEKLGYHRLYKIGFDGVVWSYCVSSSIHRGSAESCLKKSGLLSLPVTVWENHMAFVRASEALRNPVQPNYRRNPRAGT